MTGKREPIAPSPARRLARLVAAFRRKATFT